RLGRPFEQVESQLTKSHQGSGLGLAIAKSLTELHPGAMRIRSAPEIGTMVLLPLPVSPTAAPKEGLAGAPAQSHPAPRLHADIAVANNLAPLGDFRPDPFGKMIGCARDRIEAEREQTLPEFRRRDDFGDRAVEEIDDLARRSRGCHEAGDDVRL